MSVSFNFLGGGGGGRGRHDDRRPRGNPPGPRTNYRLVVENLSSRTSWQVSDFMILIYFLQKPKVVTVRSIFKDDVKFVTCKRVIQ